MLKFQLVGLTCLLLWLIKALSFFLKKTTSVISQGVVKGMSMYNDTSITIV